MSVAAITPRKINLRACSFVSRVWLIIVCTVSHFSYKSITRDGRPAFRVTSGMQKNANYNAMCCVEGKR
jgi:hypothetical protein